MIGDVSEEGRPLERSSTLRSWISGQNDFGTESDAAPKRHRRAWSEPEPPRLLRPGKVNHVSIPWAAKISNLSKISAQSGMSAIGRVGPEGGWRLWDEYTLSGHLSRKTPTRRKPL